MQMGFSSGNRDTLFSGYCLEALPPRNNQRQSRLRCRQSVAAAQIM